MRLYLTFLKGNKTTGADTRSVSETRVRVGLTQGPRTQTADWSFHKVRAVHWTRWQLTHDTRSVQEFWRFVVGQIAEKSDDWNNTPGNVKGIVSQLAGV